MSSAEEVMDANDVKESSALKDSDKTTEEALKNALDINEALGRKGKTFKSLTKLSTKITRNFTDDLSRTTALPTTNKQFRYTTLQPKKTNEFTNYNLDKDETETTQQTITSERLSLKDAKLISTTVENILTEDQETTTAIATVTEVGTEKVTTEKETKGSSTINNINSINIEHKEKHRELTTEKSLMEEREKLTSTTYLSNHTTPMTNVTDKEFETESLTEEIVTRKSLISFNRPLIRSTTIKPDSTARRSFTPFNRLRTTKREETATSANEQNSEEPNIESNTPKSILSKNRTEVLKRFNRLKTTTVRNNDDSNGISSLDETTENTFTPAENTESPDFTTTRSLRRLIRYRTTAPPTDDDEEEEEQQQIETSTRRSFGIQKLNALTTRRSYSAGNRTKTLNFASATENISNTFQSDSENTNSEKTSTKKVSPTRLPFGTLTRNRTSGSSLGLNRHLAVTESKIENLNLSSIKEVDSVKPTSVTSEVYEAITRHTLADDPTEVTVEADKESSLVNKKATIENNYPTSRPFESLTLFTIPASDSSEDGSGENFTTEEVFTDSTMSTTAFDNISRQTVLNTKASGAETYTTMETDEKTTTYQAALSTRKPFGDFKRTSTATDVAIEETESFINKHEGSTETFAKEPLTTKEQFDTPTRPTTTRVAATDSYNTTENGIEYISNKGSAEQINRNKETNEEISKHTEFAAKGDISARKHGGLNRQKTTSEITILPTDSATVGNENSLIYKKSSTKGSLPTRSPFGGFELPETTEKSDYSDDILEEGKASNSNQKTTTKRILATRKPFGGLRQTTTISFLDTENENETTVDNEERVEGASIRFGGLTRPVTTTVHSAVEEDDSLIENEKDYGYEEDITTERSSNTRRPFKSFTRPTTNTLREADEEEAIGLTPSIKSRDENTKDNDSGKYASTSRRPFVGFTRHATSTTEASTVETYSTLKSIKQFGTSKKLNSLTQKAFTALKRPTTTENYSEENTERSLGESEETSTKQITTEPITDSPTYDNSSVASKEKEDTVTFVEKPNDEEATKVETFKDKFTASTAEENLESTFPSITEDVSEILSPINNETEKSEDDVAETTEYKPSLSTTSSIVNQEIVDIFNQENEKINMNSKESDDKTTKLNLITSHIPRSFTALRPISTTTENTETSTEESEEISDTEEEEQIASKVTQIDSTTRKSFSRLNRFQTSTESSSELKTAEPENRNSNDIKTQRNFSSLYKIQTTTESSLEDAAEKQDIKNDSVLKKPANNFNRYKTISKSSRLTEPKRSPLDSEDNTEDSTRSSLGTFSERQRSKLNSISQTERTTQRFRSNINKNLYHRDNQQNEQDEVKFQDTTPWSFSSYKQKSINSKTLKPFSFNRPQLQRTLARLPQVGDRKVYEEDENEDSDEEYSEENATSASQELTSEESSSSLLNLRKRVRIAQAQNNDSEKGFATSRLKNLLNTTARTQTNLNTLTSKFPELTTGNIDKEVAITTTSNTNTNRFGTNRYNSTVANYLHRTKTNLSQSNTNTAPSHIKQSNEVKLKIDVSKVDEEYNDEDDDDDVMSEVSNSNKFNVNQYNNNVYKGDDNDSKRRFQKYQFQRRTTTSTTTTTVAPVEADGDIEVTKTQVNLNDAYASERETSTNIPETTAPIITESTSLPATPLQRRIKVLKFKRPLVSNTNNNNNTNSNTTVNAIASSATNLNVSHTETQNIVKLSRSSIDAQVVTTETLIETEITNTQTPIAPQATPSTTPKHIRKIIRKLIRPVNRTTDTAKEIEDEKSGVATTSNRKNAARFGFNRSTKFNTTSDEDEDRYELTEKRKIQDLTNRGRNRFTLPSGVASTTRTSLFGSSHRNRFSSRLQPTSTTENSKSTEYSDEDEKDVSNEDDAEEQEELEITTTTSYPETHRLKFSRHSSSTTETITSIKDDSDVNIRAEPETTTQLDENSPSAPITEQTVEHSKEVLNDSFKLIKTSLEEPDFDGPLWKLRNKVKQDLAKEKEVEGFLSTRLKVTKANNEEEEIKSDDPLLKLRNKVKQNLAKADQVEGILSDRLKGLKNDSELEDKDDPLLKLRNKVKQESAKNAQEEGVVNVKLKKVLETKNFTSSLHHKVEDNENETTNTKDSLTLQTIRAKVQTNLAKSDQDQGVINSRLKKLLSEKDSTTLLHTNGVEEDNENEATEELKEASGDVDLLETSKSFTSRKPFVSKAKLTTVDNENPTQIPTTVAPKNRPTFRRKLVAKRPYIPTKSPLNALSTTTIRTTTTKGKSKYVRRKFGGYQALNANNRNSGEGLIRTNSRENKLPTTGRFKIEGLAGGKNTEEEYEEEQEEQEDEEVEEDEDEEEVAPRPVQAIKPNIVRPPTFFERPQTTILQKPTVIYKDQGSGDNEDENEEEEEDDEEEEEEDNEFEGSTDDDEEDENETPQQDDKTIINNRIPPAARPVLTTTPTIKKPFTPSRVANTPYRPGAITTTAPRNRKNRLGTNSKSNVKPRVVNRPLGFPVPNLTNKPVANDFEPTTVLIPTKPAPFINPNTRAYERKYSGPTTEPSADINVDSNPLIDDINIEALNARNKKIFEINSKKHTPLKPKVIMPLAKQNENTQEQQQETNTEFENDENDYQSSVDGFATTTTSTTITLNTNTQQQQQQPQQQEHKQSTTLDTTTIGTENTDDAIQSNVNNLNEISSQDGFTTTPTPNTTLLHIFTLSDAEHTTTQNPLNEGYQVVPRLIVGRVNPKHKVVEINRIVEVNSKEEKLRRKSKANTIVPIEGSQTYKVESLPHVEQLGEISVVKYVHQVDGSDITIEGRSTVTDYTPTESTISEASQPIRFSLSDESAEKRHAKELLPEVIRETETSTISLEGLFENARKGKVLNTIDDVDFVKQEANINKANNGEIRNATESPNNLHVETTAGAETFTESFNIFKSIAFDIARINWEPNSKKIESDTNNVEATTSATLTSVNSSFTTASEPEQPWIPILVTTPAPEILSEESTTVVPEDIKATTVAAALFPQYVRPIVPLLRPESNESSPLVISIANLDKVILSKVRKMVGGTEGEEDEQHPESQKQQKIDNNNKNNNTIPKNSQTETPETLTTNNFIINSHSDQIDETQTQQNPETHDSHAAFSSRLASVIKAPLTNALIQIEKQLPSKTNVTKNPLAKVQQVTQTKLYTINEGSVGSTTSSTIGSKISETVSFSSETTVIRRKQPRKFKSKKFKNTAFTTNATATNVVSES